MVFIHLFLFYFPYFLKYDINVLFYISIHHAFTITSDVSIVMEFVTFNVMWGHISISCLNISSISPAIYNLMSKVSTIKKITIKQFTHLGVNDLLCGVVLLNPYLG
jgi:hypothetical protein